MNNTNSTSWRWNAKKAFFVGKLCWREVFFAGKLALPALKPFALATPRKQDLFTKPGEKQKGYVYSIPF